MPVTFRQGDKTIKQSGRAKAVTSGKTYGVQVDDQTRNVRAKSAQRAKEDAVQGQRRYTVDGKGVYGKSRAEAMAKVHAKRTRSAESANAAADKVIAKRRKVNTGGQVKFAPPR